MPAQATQETCTMREEGAGEIPGSLLLEDPCAARYPAREGAKAWVPVISRPTMSDWTMSVPS